jgi:hypothetical protein
LLLLQRIFKADRRLPKDCLKGEEGGKEAVQQRLLCVQALGWVDLYESSHKLNGHAVATSEKTF